MGRMGKKEDRSRIRAYPQRRRVGMEDDPVGVWIEIKRPGKPPEDFLVTMEEAEKLYGEIGMSMHRATTERIPVTLGKEG